MADEIDAIDSPAESADNVTVSSDTTRDESSDRPKKARRAFLTQNACMRCRQKKSKCDGKRPVCGRCEKSNARCIYDIAQEGITKMQNLQQQIESKTRECNRLLRFFKVLQTGSDHDATTLLARLRLGEPLDTLLASIGAPHAAEASTPGKQTIADDADDAAESTFSGSWPSSPLDEDPSATWDRHFATTDRRMSYASESGLYDHRSAATLRLAEAPSSVRSIGQRRQQGPFYISARTPSEYAEDVHSVTQASDMNLSSIGYQSDVEFLQNPDQQMWQDRLHMPRRGESHSPADSRESGTEERRSRDSGDQPPPR